MRLLKRKKYKSPLMKIEEIVLCTYQGQLEYSSCLWYIYMYRGYTYTQMQAQTYTCLQYTVRSYYTVNLCVIQSCTPETRRQSLLQYSSPIQCAKYLSNVQLMYRIVSLCRIIQVFAYQKHTHLSNQKKQLRD